MLLYVELGTEDTSSTSAANVTVNLVTAAVNRLDPFTGSRYDPAVFCQ